MRDANELLELATTELEVRRKEITRLRLLLIRARKQVTYREDPRTRAALLWDIDEELENTD